MSYPTKIHPMTELVGWNYKLYSIIFDYSKITGIEGITLKTLANRLRKKVGIPKHIPVTFKGKKY